MGRNGLIWLDEARSVLVMLGAKRSEVIDLKSGSYCKYGFKPDDSKFLSKHEK